MNFLNKDDNNIIICKPSVKDYLLKKSEQENEFFNIKFSKVYIFRNEEIDYVCV